MQIQAGIGSGHYELAWSYILDFENTANPLEERRSEIQKWETLASVFAVETPEILKMMEEHTAVGFKPLDALHIACARALACEFFLTVDKGVLKKAKAVSAVRIMNPVEFVFEQGL